MSYGYCGKVLRINLSKNEISMEEPPDTFYRRYFGGEAVIGYYLLKELKKGIDPLDTENMLIFAPGVLTGHPFSGSGRNCVGGKSPLTGGIGTTEVGGYWGAELKRAGYDAIIVKGCADSSSYIWISEGKAEIRSAEELWGKTTGYVEERIKKESGNDVRIAQIGPAGERKVRYACIINDLSHAAGRTGMGAVMGSKHIKAIAVKGSKSPQLANPDRVREKAKRIAGNPETILPLDTTLKQFQKTGTGGGLPSLSASGGLPTRNFKQGSFEDNEEISGEKMAETILIDRHTCYACAVRCKRTVKVEVPYEVDPKYGGPEYETLASFGSNCGISDLKAIAKANEICNAYGLDTISAGMAISFAMECFEEGIITEKDTDGIPLRFGNADAMLKTLTNIVERKGLGKILGEGVKRAADEIGKGSEKYALHVKGQEIPMHEPRFKKALGIGYAVSHTGADHVHNLHDTYVKGWGDHMKDLQSLGVLETIPINLLNPEKIRLLVYFSNFRHFANCGVFCIFTPWFYTNTSELVNDVTGWNTSIWEIMKVGERAVTLARIFNVREGFNKEYDFLPERFSQSFDSGPIAGEMISKEEVDRWKKVYYGMMGWDEEGVPTPEKLHELDIGWAIEHLPE